MNQAVVAHFREQAGFCTAYGSPFTGALCEHFAEDVEDNKFNRIPVPINRDAKRLTFVGMTEKMICFSLRDKLSQSV